MKNLNQYPLVSIITPCYNTGNLVNHLLDSILMQDYPNVEMFAINDGSTDNTCEVINNYITRFKEKGYKLTYIFQQNSGQSVAINNGLKLINGKYLVWPDSDDWYASEKSISKMVDHLEHASEEFAMVRTQEQVVDEATSEVLLITGKDAKEQEDKSLFEDCLYVENNFYFCSGAYMVKTSVLKETTDLDIFTAKDAGQNWQLLLPVLYKYRCLTIKEILYTVLQRTSSHSRGQYDGYIKSLRKYQVYQDTIQETLLRIKGLPDTKKAYYQREIKLRYLMINLLLDFQYNQIDAFKARCAELKKADHCSWKESFLSLGLRLPFVKIQFAKKMIRTIYKVIS